MASKQQKRQAKSGASKRRSKRYVAPERRDEIQTEASSDDEYTGGAMQSLTSGFKRAVGVETKKKKTWVDHVWTVLLLLAIAAVLFWRFGSN
ncbi:MAG: hypothetical protein R3B99_04390 [Polyangiales bacterium]